MFSQFSWSILYVPLEGENQNLHFCIQLLFYPTIWLNVDKKKIKITFNLTHIHTWWFDTWRVKGLRTFVRSKCVFWQTWKENMQLKFWMKIFHWFEHVTASARSQALSSFVNNVLYRTSHTMWDKNTYLKKKNDLSYIKAVGHKRNLCYVFNVRPVM